MRMNLKRVGFLSLAILFGGVAIFMGLGLWQTESTKTPAKYTTGIFAGEANPADIRGSYTFSEIADAFDVPTDVLKEAFMIPSDVDPDDIKSKDLEGMYTFGQDIEVGNGSMKLFVALYKNLPYTLGEDYLLEPAVALIEAAQPTLSSEIKDYLETHTIGSDGSLPVEASNELKEVSGANDATMVADEPASAEVTPSESMASSETENEAASDQTISEESTSGQTTTESQPSTSTENQTAAVNNTSAEHSEPAETNLIKGNTTFQQVLDLGVTIDQIETILQAKMPQRSMTVKDYCINNGLEFSSVKAEIQALVSQ